MKLISVLYNTKQIILRTSPFPSESGSCGLWQQQWLKQKIKPCEHFVQDFSTRYLRLTNVSSCWEVLICLHYFKHNWLKPELLSLGQHSGEIFRTHVSPRWSRSMLIFEGLRATPPFWTVLSRTFRTQRLWKRTPPLSPSTHPGPLKPTACIWSHTACKPRPPTLWKERQIWRILFLSHKDGNNTFL